MLCRFDLPGVSVDSASMLSDSATYSEVCLTRALSGEYYLVLRRRIPLKHGVEQRLLIIQEYFSDPTKVTHSCIRLHRHTAAICGFIDLSPFRYGLLFRRCQSDNGVDGSDLSLIDNSAYIFASPAMWWVISMVTTLLMPLILLLQTTTLQILVV
ncbi:MAG: hypothetical protein IPG99_11880 [Ignavibacteria bacterium]|nr:hypothetical protein [Ignavibacteria bacterium]